MVSVKHIFLAVVLISLSCPPVQGAQGDDPDWPCIQRKVPELSIGQIWTGPTLPVEAADWSNDEVISEMVEELAARRMPLPEAQERIKAYRDTLPPEQRPLRTAMLIQGLFDKMNGERSHVISGIARYAHRQRDMASELRRESSALDVLRNKSGADGNEIAVRTERLTFQTRIFQERVHSLTYVCEVPTLIEQRLYALVKTLTEAPPEK
ncbi:hypothetical protein SAMN03159496_01950 [Rhizobium sp. NFR07]|uniref:hypothetical protein n=1 Tax=Rhizobium sp. NFR07 TaxID=1566262 RepID=UPI0008EA4CA8|nr:hypothetical protein [Rhizobium sp. NFR07]SFB14268.1 hypothetical protein SAMN03159496_01950 [Rhizobium sp. NFR07]